MMTRFTFGAVALATVLALPGTAAAQFSIGPITISAPNPLKPWEPPVKVEGVKPPEQIAEEARRATAEAMNNVVPGSGDAFDMTTPGGGFMPGQFGGDPVPFELSNGGVRVKTPQEMFEELRRFQEEIENHLTIGADELARAIRLGANRARVSSRPLPAFVKKALRGYMDSAVLNRARYSTDTDALNGTIEEFILANEFAAAVTLDNIVVFADASLADTDDEDTLQLWIHELTHVEQYGRYTVEGFARRYITDWQRLEGDAEDNALDIFARLSEEEASDAGDQVVAHHIW